MFKRVIKMLAGKFGYRIVKIYGEEVLAPDIEPEFWDRLRMCRPFTMLSIDRLYAIDQAIRYVVAQRIPGDFVQCGVWKGGSVMLMALTAIAAKDTGRKIYLYDTFEGMTEPTSRDVQSCDGKPAHERWKMLHDKGERWSFASLEEVREKVLSVGYPKENFLFIKGRVEETIPRQVPAQIAALYLDTDWYDSTKHELAYLYPRLSSKGVMIIDDYGHFSGAREAVDEYFQIHGPVPLLQRIDYTGRLVIKH